MRRRAQDPEYRKKVSAGVRASKQRMTAEERSEAAQKTHTPESDQRRQAAMQARWEDPEYRAHRAEVEAQPGTKARRSAATTEVNNRPGRRELQSEIMREKFAADENFRQRHAAGLQRVTMDPKYAGRRSTAMKQAWREMRGNLRNSFKMLEERPLTTYESVVAIILITADVPFIPHDTSSNWEIDLYVPALRLDIEVDGAHHKSVECAARDSERDTELVARGYRVYRISHASIDNGTFITPLYTALGL
jgi:hypothetical protein